MAVVLLPGVGAPAQPRVSVCIANFNGAALLPDCIDSVLAQDCEAAIEILVHDDASRDGSVTLLRSHYPQVHALVSEENVGFCISNNRMVDAAKGEYVLLLNNDAALPPQAVRQLLADAELGGKPAILTLPQYDWETGTLVDRGCLLDPFHTPDPNLDLQHSDVAYVIGACLWIPRTTWDELGGFPEWFGSIAEDMYLCCAARLRGIPVRCLGGSGYRHRQGASFGGNRIDGQRLSTRYHRRYLSERNRLAVLVACTPTWLAWPWLALHTVALLAEGLLLSLLKATPRIWREIYWAALRDVIRRRRQLLDQRNALQARRTISLVTYLRGFNAIPRKLVLLYRHGLPGIRG